MLSAIGFLLVASDIAPKAQACTLSLGHKASPRERIGRGWRYVGRIRLPSLEQPADPAGEEGGDGAATVVGHGVVPGDVRVRVHADKTRRYPRIWDIRI